MDKHYTIYIKTSCPFCVQARDELFRQKVSHTVHIMDDKPEGLQKMKELVSILNDIQIKYVNNIVL